jgi:hypothetical protein
MQKRNPVYGSVNGKVVTVTKSQSKDALLFATSKASLSAVTRAKRAQLRKANEQVLQLVQLATSK